MMYLISTDRKSAMFVEGNTVTMYHHGGTVDTEVLSVEKMLYITDHMDYGMVYKIDFDKWYSAHIECKVSTGDILLINGLEYILAQTSVNEYQLINLSNGNRYDDKKYFTVNMTIPLAELIRFYGCGNITKKSK